MILEGLFIIGAINHEIKNAKKWWKETYPEIAEYILTLLDEDHGTTATVLSYSLKMDRNLTKQVCNTMVRQGLIRSEKEKGIIVYYPNEKKEKKVLTNDARCAIM